MNFHSLAFLTFFPIVVLFYYMIPQKAKRYWLLAASFYFYACLSIRYLLLLILCIFISYFGGIVIERDKENLFQRKVSLIACLLILLGSLCFFKYIPFVLTSLNILLPVGMSFYILQMIAYLVDLYKGKAACEKNIVNYGLFICFFPKLISGPLVKSGDFLEQVKTAGEFDEKQVQAGLLMMLFGFFEKMVIAETASQAVATVFGNFRNMHALYLLAGAFLYSIYIYCDFGGYSHIAIGAAKVMGFEMEDNFRQPYFAVSIKDFWRRWHISLSGWLKDYVYIPLGGSRKGRGRTYVNLMLVFLVSGLWHGSGWRFVFWGMLHGMYQIGEDLLGRFSPITLWDGIRRIRTWILVTFAWIFFASPSLREGVDYIIGMCTRWNGGITGSFMAEIGLIPVQFVYLLGSLMVLLVIDICREKNVPLGKWVLQIKNPFRWAIYLAASIFIILVAFRSFGQEASNFIYAQF